MELIPYKKRRTQSLLSLPYEGTEEGDHLQSGKGALNIPQLACVLTSDFQH